jgi:hypothetical protein
MGCTDGSSTYTLRPEALRWVKTPTAASRRGLGLRVDRHRSNPRRPAREVHGGIASRAGVEVVGMGSAAVTLWLPAWISTVRGVRSCAPRLSPSWLPTGGLYDYTASLNHSPHPPLPRNRNRAPRRHVPHPRPQQTHPQRRSATHRPPAFTTNAATRSSPRLRHRTRPTHTTIRPRGLKLNRIKTTSSSKAL